MGLVREEWFIVFELHHCAPFKLKDQLERVYFKLGTPSNLSYYEFINSAHWWALRCCSDLDARSPVLNSKDLRGRRRYQRSLFTQKVSGSCGREEEEQEASQKKVDSILPRSNLYWICHIACVIGALFAIAIGVHGSWILSQEECGDKWR